MGKHDLQIKWQIEVKDKSGQITASKTGTSKSLLRNFMYYLQSKFQITAVGGNSVFTAPDTTNTSRTLPHTGNLTEGFYGYFGALNSDSSKGLRVGLGVTPVTPEDYELASLIVQGTGGNQMNYGDQTLEAVIVVGQTSSFRVTRAFTNNSGSIISIAEIGAAFSEVATDTIEYRFLYLRDVLPSVVGVPDGSTFTLRYTFSVTA